MLSHPTAKSKTNWMEKYQIRLHRTRFQNTMYIILKIRIEWLTPCCQVMTGDRRNQSRAVSIDGIPNRNDVFFYSSFRKGNRCRSFFLRQFYGSDNFASAFLFLCAPINESRSPNRFTFAQAKTKTKHARTLANKKTNHRSISNAQSNSARFHRWGFVSRSYSKKKHQQTPSNRVPQPMNQSAASVHRLGQNPIGERSIPFCFCYALKPKHNHTTRSTNQTSHNSRRTNRRRGFGPPTHGRNTANTRPTHDQHTTNTRLTHD